MQKRIFKFRIYPNQKVQNFIERQDGCNRKVWNHFIELEQKMGYYISYNEMCDQLAHVLKFELPYLREVNAQSLQQTLKDLDRVIGEHKKYPNRIKKPKFKKWSWRKSFRVPQACKVNSSCKKITLPKLQKWPIKIILNRPLPKYTMVTIVKESDDRYYACFIAEIESKDHVPNVDTKHLGIDLGLKDLITTSNKEKICPPKFLIKEESNIVRKNRGLSKKKKGSRGFKKFQKQVARAHAKVRRQRADFIHKLTTKIANDNEGVVVESLRIQGMVKNHILAKGIFDASWGTICSFLDYKLTMRGKSFIACGTQFPSTQKCSNCDQITGPKGKIGLSRRQWTCSHCGSIHDRDINAAKNIAIEGDKIYLHENRLTA